MITTVDNYIGLVSDGKPSQPIGYKCFIDNKKQNDIFIKLADYKSKSADNIFFSFFEKDEDKKDSKNADDLIVAIKKSKNERNEDIYQANIGNYIGKFKYNGIDIDIKSRFGDKLLERMLNYANDIYLDDVSITGDIDKKENTDYSKFIIYYLFVQSLEKAYMLGLPKAYTSVKYHEATLKGRININSFIKNDIPFQGKISSISREQKEIQEVIDVLYKAIKIIGKDNGKGKTSYKGFLKNISHVVPHLKENRSKNFVSKETINKAINTKALQNPIFAPYKKVLKYAKHIINTDSIKENENGKDTSFGFLVNVAELFEIYITKLLQKEFLEWNVESPKISLYDGLFYERKIIPDIVMTRRNDVIVFDTKYKRMLMDGKNQYGAGDVDRNDLFQINTYMTYYQNHPEKYNLIAGGLLYPMENFNKVKCHTGTWMGKEDTKFIIDGIELNNVQDQSKEITRDELLYSETKFIARIQGIISYVKTN